MNQPAAHTRRAASPASRDPARKPPEQSIDRIALAHQEHLLDESLMQTFPASDPISQGFIT